MDWKINSHGDRFAEAGADPNHDGVPLIFDYALGEGERPSMVMENGIPLLRFDRIAAHQDIVLTIQKSDDLIDWASRRELRQRRLDLGRRSRGGFPDKHLW